MPAFIECIHTTYTDTDTYLYCCICICTQTTNGQKQKANQVAKSSNNMTLCKYFASFCLNFRTVLTLSPTTIAALHCVYA